MPRTIITGALIKITPAKTEYASTIEGKGRSTRINREISLATGAGGPNTSDWWIDSGASQHMTHSKLNMTKLKKFKNPVQVQLLFDTETFRRKWGESSRAIFCSPVKLMFPGILLICLSMLLLITPSTPMTTGTIRVFSPHILAISMSIS